MTNEEFAEVFSALKPASTRALCYMRNSMQFREDGRMLAFALSDFDTPLGRVRERGEAFDAAKCVTGNLIAYNWMRRPIRYRLVQRFGNEYAITGKGLDFVHKVEERKLRIEHEKAANAIAFEQAITARVNTAWWKGVFVAATIIASIAFGIEAIKYFLL